MAKFRVMYKSTDYVYLDVEADSLEEAKEIAENTDGGEFIEDEDIIKDTRLFNQSS